MTNHPVCILQGCVGTARHPVTFALDGETPITIKICDEHHRLVSGGATVRLKLNPALPGYSHDPRGDR